MILGHEHRARVGALDGWGERSGWAAICTGAGALVVFDSHTSVRPILVLAAMIVGPGWALCGSLRIPDKKLVWAIVISTGLAVNVLLGLVMIASHTWRPVGASVILLFGSAVLLVSRPAAAGMRELGLDTGDASIEGWKSPAIWAAICTLAALFVTFDVHIGIRAPLVLAAMIAGPGWACCGSLRIRDRNLVWAIAISVGLAINVILALAMIAIRSWQPVGASVLLLLVSAAFLASRSVRIAARAIAGGAE